MGPEDSKREANLHVSIEEFRYGFVGGFFNDINRIVGIGGLVSMSSKQKTGLTCA